MTELPSDDVEFAEMLAEYGGNAAAMSRATGIDVSRIKRRRRKVELPTREVSVFYYSDVHGGEHADEGAVERMLDHMASEEWDHVVDGGDRIDAYSVSRYDKDPRRIADLPEELAWSRDHSRRVEDRAGKAKLHFTRGNHEQRIPDYIRRKAPGLEGLKELSLEDLMGLDGWGVHGREGVVIEGVRFYHGDYTAKGAGNSVRKAMDSLWQSVVQGHCHRQAVVKTRKHTEFVGVEAGCLCKMDPEYMNHPDWKLGWVVVRIGPDGVRVEEHNP